MNKNQARSSSNSGRFFMVLSPRGQLMAKLPFMSREESSEYDNWVKQQTRRELIQIQPKVEEEATNELEFEPFVPQFYPIDD